MTWGSPHNATLQANLVKKSRLANSSSCCRLTTCKFLNFASPIRENVLILFAFDRSTGIKRNVECEARSLERKRLQVPPSTYWPRLISGCGHSLLSPSVYCHSPVWNSHLRETPQIKLRKIVYVWGKLFTYSHCSLTNWENKSPDKFFNLLPFNHL